MLHHSVDLTGEAAKRFRQEPEGAEMQEGNAKEMLLWEKSSLKWKSVLACSILYSIIQPSNSTPWSKFIYFPIRNLTKKVQNGIGTTAARSLLDPRVRSTWSTFRNCTFPN